MKYTYHVHEALLQILVTSKDAGGGGIYKRKLLWKRKDGNHVLEKCGTAGQLCIGQTKRRPCYRL